MIKSPEPILPTSESDQPVNESSEPILPTSETDQPVNVSSSPISKSESNSTTATELCTPASFISKDPAEWTINDFTIDILLSKEIDQNKSAENFWATKTFYPKINKCRSLHMNHFQRKLVNGEMRERKYLIYSPTKKAVFCIPCLLFGGTSKLAKDGYNNWSNIGKVLNSHENSPEHHKCQLIFLKRSNTITHGETRIDTQLQDQIEMEANYWRNVLRRVVAVVKKLSSRGLPLRGDNELIGSNKNGNFLMCFELLSEFDPFMATHLQKYGNPGKGKTSYTSSTTCNEFISLMASKVRKTILNEIKSSKYYSIIVDSTPDISHTDQLSLVIKYVDKSGEPVERFIQFIPNVGHKATDMENAILNTLASYDLNLKDCRGQSYDNANNMSGCYAGLQALLSNPETGNELAFFVPCAAHSLNLVGMCSVESIFQIYTYFDLLQELYTFFSMSTHRWEILQNALGKKKKCR